MCVERCFEWMVGTSTSLHALSIENNIHAKTTSINSIAPVHVSFQVNHRRSVARYGSLLFSLLPLPFPSPNHTTTMNLSAPHTPNPRLHSPNSSSRRPATIAELAERALDNLWDESKELKYYLRVAEKYRRDGKDFVQKGDLESAFVEFARAATLVLEKLPSHRDYHTLLNAAQRHNLGLVSIPFGSHVH